MLVQPANPHEAPASQAHAQPPTAPLPPPKLGPLSPPAGHPAAVGFSAGPALGPGALQVLQLRSSLNLAILRHRHSLVEALLQTLLPVASPLPSADQRHRLHHHHQQQQQTHLLSPAASLAAAGVCSGGSVAQAVAAAPASLTPGPASSGLVTMTHDAAGSSRGRQAEGDGGTALAAGGGGHDGGDAVDAAGVTYRTSAANHSSRAWLWWHGEPDRGTSWLAAELHILDPGAAGGHLFMGLGPRQESLLAAAAPPAGAGPAPQDPVLHSPLTYVMCVLDGQPYQAGSPAPAERKVEAKAGDRFGIFWSRHGGTLTFLLNGGSVWAGGCRPSGLAAGSCPGWGVGIGRPGSAALPLLLMRGWGTGRHPLFLK